jgi:hypothetical protein
MQQESQSTARLTTPATRAKFYSTRGDIYAIHEGVTAARRKGFKTKGTKRCEARSAPAVKKIPICCSMGYDNPRCLLDRDWYRQLMLDRAALAR